MAKSACQSFMILLTYLFVSAHSEDLQSNQRIRRDYNEWVVTTITMKPYLTESDQASSSTRFEGFIPDLMKAIAGKMNRKYRLELVSDGIFGTYNQSLGSWNGMIGEIISGKADMAAAPITVSDARKKVVDFSSPFMTFPTVVLLRKSPPGITPPQTITDLLDQPNIRYGVINRGATESMIRSSADPALERLKERLEPIDSIQDGINKLRAGKEGQFAVIMEESTADFWRKQEPCDLIQININQMAHREYAFALKKGSPDVTEISKVIDAMKSSGEIEELRKKWWSGACGAAQITTSGSLTLISVAALLVLIRSDLF